VCQLPHVLELLIAARPKECIAVNVHLLLLLRLLLLLLCRC
jgi:hypothetical protein